MKTTLRLLLPVLAAALAACSPRTKEPAEPPTATISASSFKRGLDVDPGCVGYEVCPGGIPLAFNAYEVSATRKSYLIKDGCIGVSIPRRVHGKDVFAPNIFLDVDARPGLGAVALIANVAVNPSGITAKTDCGSPVAVERLAAMEKHALQTAWDKAVEAHAPLDTTAQRQGSLTEPLAVALSDVGFDEPQLREAFIGE